jgi:hypothetical protein
LSSLAQQRTILRDRHLNDGSDAQVIQPQRIGRAMERAMDKAIDTSRTVAVDGSTFGTVLSLVMSIIALLALGILTAFFVLFAVTMGNTVFVFFSYVLAGCCALGAFVCVMRIRECGKFLKISNNVLTISPDGIRDRRVTEELVPWQAVKSVRTTVHEPDHYYATRMFGGVTPVRRTPLDVVLDIDPALISQALKHQALISSGASRMLGMRDALEDTRPWITLTIDLWRLRNITASTLYDICQAYVAAARGKHAG